MSNMSDTNGISGMSCISNDRYFVTGDVFGVYDNFFDKYGYESLSMARLLAIEFSKSVPVILEHRTINSCENSDHWEVIYAETYENGKKTSL